MEMLLLLIAVGLFLVPVVCWGSVVIVAIVALVKELFERR